MGSAIAANLVRSGRHVVGYDVAAARRRALRAAGGVAASGTPDVARRTEVVISSLPSSAALAAVAGEIASASRRPAVVVETSTLPLAAKEEARRVLRDRGVTLLDAPISGTGAQARTGDIVLYVSGDAAAYRRVATVLDGFCRGHYFLGPFGAGSKMKYVANLLVAIHNVATAEALVLAMKAGLDPARVVELVGAGAGASRVLQLRGPMMARGDYADATMKIEVFQKDLAIIGAFARELGCPTPLLSAAEPIYTAAAAAGRKAEDTAAVCAVLESWANYRRPASARRTR